MSVSETSPATAVVGTNNGASPTSERLLGPPVERPDEVCDRVTLDGLWAEGDSLLPELVGMFQSELTTALDELGRALTARDWAATARIAHTLRGSAGTFGATHMHELATRIDKAARAGEADQVTATYDEFRSECERVRRYLAAELERKLGPDRRSTK